MKPSTDDRSGRSSSESTMKSCRRPQMACGGIALGMLSRLPDLTQGMAGPLSDLLSVEGGCLACFIVIW